MVKFYRGLYEKYNQETHADGIYFATDKGVIRMNGKDYVGALGTQEAVTRVELSTDGTELEVEFTNGTVQTISLASDDYTSAIEDKSLEVPTAVGGIAKGTTVEDLEGMSYAEIIDALLFPTVYPTFTNPSATIKLSNYSTPQEVGAAAPTDSNFSTSYNAGAITLNDVKQANRGGAQDSANSFIYVNGNAENKTLPTTVALGDTTYTYRAAFAEGPQPKDNKGNDYDSPLIAGYVDSSSAATINGTYPWYASTSTATAQNPVIKQTLVAWKATAGSMSTGNFTLQPSGTLAQVFKLPRQIKTLQMLNTVSGAMETIGTTDYTETTETITIGSTNVTYYVYTYNGSTRGEVTLLAKF